MADFGLASWLGATMSAPAQSHDDSSRAEASTSSGPAQDLAPKVAASDALAAALAKGNTLTSKAEPKGFRLPPSSDSFDVDSIPATHIQQVQVTTVANVKTEYKERILTQVAANVSCICYGVRGGMIRALSKSTANKTLLKGHTPQVTDMQFSDGTNIFASCDEAGTLHVRALTLVEGADTIQDELLVQQQFGANPVATRRLAWHPKLDSLLAVLGTNTISFVNVPPTAGVASSPEFSQPATPAGPQTAGLFTCVAFSPSGHVLAAADDASRVHVWLLPHDFTTKAQVDPLPIAADLVLTAYDSAPQPCVIHLISGHKPCQTTLVTGDHTGSHLKLWDLQWPEPSVGSSSGSAGVTGSCSYELRLTSKEGCFNHMVVQHTHNMVILANTKKQQMYVLHVSTNTATHLPVFDYLVAFSVALPILSIAISSEPMAQDENGQDVLHVYTVQTDAVQEYSVYPAACLPAAELEEEEHARQQQALSDRAQLSSPPVHPIIPPTLHMPQLTTRISQPPAPAPPEPVHPPLATHASDAPIPAPAPPSAEPAAGQLGAAPLEPHTPGQRSFGGSDSSTAAAARAEDDLLTGVSTPPQLEPEVPAPPHGETNWEAVMKKLVGPEGLAGPGGSSGGAAPPLPGPPPMIPVSLLQAANRQGSYSGAAPPAAATGATSSPSQLLSDTLLTQDLTYTLPTGTQVATHPILRKNESVDSLDSDATSPAQAQGPPAPIAPPAATITAVTIEPAVTASLGTTVAADGAESTVTVGGDVAPVTATAALTGAADNEGGGESSAGSAPGGTALPPAAPTAAPMTHAITALDSEAGQMSAGGAVEGAGETPGTAGPSTGGVELPLPTSVEGVDIAAGATAAGDGTKRRKKVTVNKTARDASVPGAGIPPPPVPSPQLLKRSSTSQAAAAGGADIAVPASGGMSGGGDGSTGGMGRLLGLFATPAGTPGSVPPAAATPGSTTGPTGAAGGVGLSPASGAAMQALAGLVPDSAGAAMTPPSSLVQPNSFDSQFPTQLRDALKQLRTELRAEIKSEFKNATKALETSVKQLVDKANDKKDRDEQSRAITAAVQTVVVREVNNKVQELQRSLVTQMSATLASTMKAALAEALPSAAQQAVDRALSTALRTTLPRVVSESLKETFATSVVPGVERATQVMFGQMQGALNSALSSHKAAAAEATTSVQAAATQLNQLSAVVKAELSQLSSARDLAGSATTSSTSRRGDPAGLAAAAAAPQPPKPDPATIMKEHLRHRQFESAFNVALTSADRSHLSWLLKQLDPLTVLGEPCMLSQGVILSLLSHLSLGLESDTERNLHWITTAASAIDVTDVQCRSHGRLVLEPLKRAVGQLSMTQAGEVGRAAKTCVHIVNSLLHTMAEN